MADPDSENTDPFPLHSAARDGRDLAVRELLRSSPALVSQRDDDNRTPIFWAVSSANLPITQLLLTAAPPDFDIDSTDEAGWTLTHIAASVGSLGILDLLLQRDPSLAAKTSAGQTPLHYAVSRVRIDVARRLVEKYAAAARVKDKLGQIPLHRAAAIGNIPLINLLVADARGPINPTDRDGWTALFHASAEGHGDAVIELLKLGADPTILDRENHSFLDVCVDDKVRKWIIDVAKREGLSI